MSDFFKNNHALSGNVVLIYSKVFLNSKFLFQENAKTKMYTLEDSLGMCVCASIEGSVESAHLRRLDRPLDARQYDKYKNLQMLI